MKTNALVFTPKFCLILFLLCILFSIIGVYVGGGFFLIKSKISLSFLSFFTLIDYYSIYNDNKEIVKLIFYGGGVTALISLMPVFFVFFVFFVLYEKESLHGDARWINDLELGKSGLIHLKDAVPYILLGKVAGGRYKGHYIKFGGQQGVGLGAPTRGGKGVSMVIPNLLNYMDSVVVSDIKLENFRLTAGFRSSQGQDVFLFAPDGYAEDENSDRIEGKLRSHCWNPMSYIRRNNIYRVGDVISIGLVFYPLTGDKNDIWNELAGKLFKGFVLFMLDREEEEGEVSFSRLLSLVAQEDGLEAWMKKQIEIGVSEDCKDEFLVYIEMAEDTRSSVLSNLLSPLSIFSDAVCAAATSFDDFDLRDVRKKRMSVFVGVQPANLSRFSKLLNLFWSQLIGENTKVLPADDPSLKYQCLMLLDEFPALGRVDAVVNAVGYSAGYNMRFLLIYQSEAQLEDSKLYKKEGCQVLKDNLAVTVVFPPKNVDAATKALSETLGYKTIKIKNKSWGKHGVSYSGSEQKRALVLPQEIVGLGFERYKGVGLKELIIMENMRPMIANKIIYFDEPRFMERVNYSILNIPTIKLLNLEL